MAAATLIAHPYRPSNLELHNSTQLQCAHPHSSSSLLRRRLSYALSRVSVSHSSRHCARLPRCAATSEDDNDLGASFSEEINRRSMAEARQLELQEAESFDGAALLEIIRERYERSYDVTLARRTLAGKTFISLNIMWAYREQASFALTEEEHLNRLDYAAEALRAWGQVRVVKQSIASQRSRPRMGKAISVQLDVPERAVQEWFGN